MNSASGTRIVHLERGLCIGTRIVHLERGLCIWNEESASGSRILRLEETMVRLERRMLRLERKMDPLEVHKISCVSKASSTSVVETH